MTARHVVVRSSRVADESAMDRLAELGVATAHEAIGRAGLLDPGLLPRQQDTLSPAIQATT